MKSARHDLILDEEKNSVRERGKKLSWGRTLRATEKWGFYLPYSLSKRQRGEGRRKTGKGVKPI